MDYMRDGIPDAKMSLGFLDMVDIKEIERGPATVIEDDIEERESFTVKFKHAIEYTENFEHEFSRTTSFSEAAKQAWEVAAKASLSVEYAGIKAQEPSKSPASMAKSTSSSIRSRKRRGTRSAAPCHSRALPSSL